VNAGELAKIASRAAKLLGHGEPLLAYDFISEGLTKSPRNVRLRQLKGLALARSGATRRANVILQELRDENQSDEETLGMLGRTFKDLAAQNQNDRETLLKRAAEIYDEAYRTSGGDWSGINAATLSLLVGERQRANKLAQEVRAQCVKEVEDRRGDSYWQLAALGEAALVLHDLKEAADWYARALGEANRRFGDLQSSRRNAQLILQHWKEDPAWIDNYLRIPNVIVFAGHMIDRSDRPVPRFPPEVEPMVAQAIRGKIDILKPGFGFAPAACGSDILFLEAMLDVGAEIIVVLPYNKEEFVRDSVDLLPGANWRSRFDRVLERASKCVIDPMQRLDVGGVSYDFGKELLLGLATIHAQSLETSLIPLVVWDGKIGDGPGGTASTVEHWRSLGHKPEIIDLAEIYPNGVKLNRHEETPPRIIQPKQFGARIVAILFADAVRFSKLSETEVPQFVQHFLGAIAKLSEKFASSILAKNTWGDGLYFVFSDVDLAGQFALQLADLAANIHWEKEGLPRETSLRIGLHAGPAYEFEDPITRNRTYGGTHVSRAARIEPITPPGQVYASEAFAALAAARGTKSFVCDYVGQTPMAKGYGTLPTYYVRRAAPVAARL